MKSLDLVDSNLIKEVSENHRNKTSGRGRDKSVAIPKRKKKLLQDVYEDDQAGQTHYSSSTGRQGLFGMGQQHKRQSISSRRSKQNLEEQRQGSPMQIRKSIKKKNLLLGQNVNLPQASNLQEVGIFKNFLLQNDSQYIEYANCEFVQNLLDTQMMKENMISFMAQLMGNATSKDNFFLKTRLALQDTLTLFYIAKNIGQNSSVEFYLPRLVEMIADLLDIERCSIYLYDRIKDEIYCKVITGRMKDPISFSRMSHNILCDVFNRGDPIFIKNAQIEDIRDNLGDYNQIDLKLHQVTRNLMIIPIKLGNNAVGCIELANKKGTQEFTDHDQSIIQQICDEIARGLISYEMKFNIKKEFDEELKQVKGLMGETYQQILIPIVNDLSEMIRSLLQAERVVMFLHNRDIDHLYSLALTSENQSQNNQFQSTFRIDTIRMKSNLGLAGKAFTSMTIKTENQASDSKYLTQDEKDLGKLKLQAIQNVMAIPILEKQNNTPIAVMQIYNYENTKIEEGILWSFSNFLSSVLFTLDLQQGVYLTQDVLEAQFNLINDGVIILNTTGIVTKVNKSSQILFNTTPEIAVGKHITELLTANNNHLFNAFKEQDYQDQQLQGN
ncbi:pas pac sensor protein [Stylonychia lemnae]|uniref:Pas pac sensor protein n=1 Tax=Stylonychia lemnae TaxID=5949 RepID=A0A078A2B7_STYLE|nr:pas pac sensor protein [Stylonychia lemnae]|eukprot:CDW76346.1 pas pac sensor protein [Stylonychia lemnae]